MLYNIFVTKRIVSSNNNSWLYCRLHTGLHHVIANYVNIQEIYKYTLFLSVAGRTDFTFNYHMTKQTNYILVKTFMTEFYHVITKAWEDYIKQKTFKTVI